MPDMTTPPTESGEPSTIAGGSSFTPVRVEEAATEAVLDADGVGIRAPSHDDGALLWEIARAAGTLDVNSPYAYMMQCRNFRNTCAVAEVYGRPAGFVTAHRLPDRPDVLFVWQVAVLPDFRGLRIATRLIDDILGRDANGGIRTVEATVSPSNAASRALFTALARAKGATLNVQPCFAADDFPEGEGHEAEELYVVSPVAAVS